MTINMLDYVSHDGYRKVRVGNTIFHEEEIVWILFYGYLPDKEIVHRNGCLTDNRMANLRLKKMIGLIDTKEIDQRLQELYNLG